MTRPEPDTSDRVIISIRSFDTLGYTGPIFGVVRELVQINAILRTHDRLAGQLPRTEMREHDWARPYAAMGTARNELYALLVRQVGEDNVDEFEHMTGTRYILTMHVDVSGQWRSGHTTEPGSDNYTITITP